MRSSLFISTLLLFTSIIHGQVKIGENVSNIDTSSILELESTTQTLVLTRLNNTQMMDITPLNGALVYNVDTKCIHYFDGIQWKNLCDSTNNFFSIVDNNNGSFTITANDGSSYTSPDLTGPQGIQGPAGNDGATGPQGIQGLPGNDGTDGANGNDGQDGVGIASTVDNNNGTFTLNFTDSSSFTTSDLTGPQGPQGIQGPAGNDGTDGATGPQGLQGLPGIDGTDGANGNDGQDGVGIASTVDNNNGTFTLNFTDSSSFTTSDLTGPQGPQGIQGQAGNDGADGATGPQGIQGLPGNDGADGANGNDGQDGVGISSTVNNNNGTFTLNFTDSSSFTTSDLTGPQGPQGIQGPAGNDGADGATGPQGPQGDPATDDQTLSTTGASGNISISGGNTIALNVNDADADDTNEIQTLSKSGTQISLSNGGGTVNETNTMLSQNASSGVITYIPEQGGTQTANVISANTDNSITSGTDGGAFYYSPIKAYGKFDVTSGSHYAQGISGISKLADGKYRITMSTARSSAHYVIQLTVEESTDLEVDIYVAAQTSSTFDVHMRSLVVLADNFIDRSFHFTVLE